MSFLLSPLAEDDLAEILDYIVRDDPAAARRVRDEIFAAIHKLAENPLLGHVRQDLAPDRELRFWRVHWSTPTW